MTGHVLNVLLLSEQTSPKEKENRGLPRLAFSGCHKHARGHESCRPNGRHMTRQSQTTGRWEGGFAGSMKCSPDNYCSQKKADEYDSVAQQTSSPEIIDACFWGQHSSSKANVTNYKGNNKVSTSLRQSAQPWLSVKGNPGP